METFKHTFAGALRSFSVWFAVILAAMPDALPILQTNFATLAPFIPASMHSRILQIIAAGIVLLRLRTTVSLAEKGRAAAAKPSP